MSFTSFGFNLPYPTTIFDMSKELFPQPGQNNFVGCLYREQKLVKVTCQLKSDGIIKLYREKISKSVQEELNMISQKVNKKRQTIHLLLIDEEGLQQQSARQKKQEEHRYKKVMKTYENAVDLKMLNSNNHPQLLNLQQHKNMTQQWCDEGRFVKSMSMA